MANLLLGLLPLHHTEPALCRIDQESQVSRAQADEAVSRRASRARARTAGGSRATDGGAMTPAEQTKLINEGLNALTEQLKRVNEALELLVASLNERQAEGGKENEQKL